MNICRYVTTLISRTLWGSMAKHIHEFIDYKI